ncbi:MAG: hypothetical protein H7Z42_00475 [Roseiflexaceae bacterium]|nr:hypothetical protein [Roseiflexaceae bacterium]
MLIDLRAVFIAGLRDAARLRLALPLYIAGLLLGLVQSWPVLFSASNGQLGRINAERLLTSGDALVDLLTNQEATAATGIWLLLMPLLSLLFSACYNLFSGGILSVWDGRRSFWAGGWHFFLAFTALGLLLVVLALVALGVGSAVAVALGPMVGAGISFVLLQLLNLTGEYARAIGVTQNLRNPFALFGHAATYITRRPAALLLGLLGLALHAALVAIYLTILPLFGASPLVMLFNQLLVFAWLWLKLLRLAWARSLVAVGQASVQPSSAAEPAASAPALS